MRLPSWLVAAWVCGMVSTATAERPRPTYVITGDLQVGGVHVPQTPAGFSNVIYLNHCKPNGCQILPGGENSTRDPAMSSIVSQPSVVEPFAYDDSVWQQVVACVRETYAPFGVRITDVRPTTGDYHMGIVAGLAGNLGFPSGVGGVSPFMCGYIPNAVTFSFANVYGPNVDEICWTVAQETAHAWGLDHKYDNRDPMTYLPTGPTRKVFQDESGPCGTFGPEPCMCGGTQMNSYQQIFRTFGSSTPTPPTVRITSPGDGASVTRGFAVRAEVTDDIDVMKAELSIDGRLVAMRIALPYDWDTPETLGQGRHRVKVTGYDVGATPASAVIHVVIGKACKKPSDCEIATDTCIDGRCVAGGSVAGGFGTACVGDGDCVSGLCRDDGGGNLLCVETCEPAADGCPSGFHCEPNDGVPDEGLCLPGSEGGCGCSTGEPAGFLLAIGVLALLVRRRTAAPRP